LLTKHKKSHSVLATAKVYIKQTIHYDSAYLELLLLAGQKYDIGVKGKLRGGKGEVKKYFHHESHLLDDYRKMYLDGCAFIGLAFDKHTPGMKIDDCFH